jgi:hypothetical protein
VSWREVAPPVRWVAAGLYLLVTAVLLVSAPSERLTTHTPFNHFALLAEAWLDGHLHLARGVPEYTGYNDFAVVDGAVHVSFPPFPAVLLLPVVAVAGSADATRDGLVFVLLAGLGPALLYVALARLVEIGRSSRSFAENAALALASAFGTVFWFTAVQGTVWFAAHVVGFALTAGFVVASIDARSPLWAGIALGLAFATRAPLLFLAPFFLLELHERTKRELAAAPGTRAPWYAAGRHLARFAAPVLVVCALLAWHNHARFGDAFEFGHRHLAIAWRPRIERWGLFSLHYFGRNLGVMLASTPFAGSSGVPFRISGHGLALWVTSPFLLVALWPRRLWGARRTSYVALACASVAVALPALLYQNTGWLQFGYRFSNDFAPLVVAMIALGRRRLGTTFWALVGLSVLVNAFGALSFQRPGWERYYAYEPTQRVIFEPD